MTPAEHYAAAERLLAEVDRISVIVETDRDLPQAQVERLRGFLQERGVINPLFTGGVHIDVSPLLQAAHIHAMLASTGSQLRSLATEEQS